MPITSFRSIALKPLLLALTGACFSSFAVADQRVQIEFSAQVLGQEFVCGKEYSGIGITSSTITPSDFRFFISKVALLDASGNSTPVTLDQDGIWQYQDVVLLDFEDGSGPCQNGNSAINATIDGMIADGEYTGIEFTMGLPFELNHEDILLAPSPLNLSAMFWNWQGGHRFFKVDMASSGRPVPAPGQGKAMGSMMKPAASASGGGMMMRRGSGEEEEAAGFSVHIGSTGCAAESRTNAPSKECMNPNHVKVSFDEFDIHQHKIVADIGALLKNTNVDVNTDETAPGCMSGIRDPECAQILPAFGLAFDGKVAGKQQLFYRQ